MSAPTQVPVLGAGGKLEIRGPTVGAFEYVTEDSCQLPFTPLNTVVPDEGFTTYSSSLADDTVAPLGRPFTEKRRRVRFVEGEVSTWSEPAPPEARVRGRRVDVGVFGERGI